jgi:uncharacterized protein (TIGR02145 family)
MSKTVSKFALAAGFVLAMAFTFSCSGEDGGTDEPSSTSAENPSSSGIAPSSSSIPGSSGTTPSSSSSLPSSSSQAIIYGQPIYDGRDGQTYQTVVIGKQTWMSRNLDFETEGKCYNDNALNCTLYGRLYTWDAAMNACPAGSHLPNDMEWTTLEDFAGGSVKEAWKKLMATTNNFFLEGTDDYGFSADGTVATAYWTSEENGTNYAYARSFGLALGRQSTSKSNVLPVRCIEGDNSPTLPSSSSYTPVSCPINEYKNFCDDRDGTPYKSVLLAGKTWMAENLNFAAEGSVCYEEDPANCDKYGRLYDWQTAMAFFEPTCNKIDCSSWTTENNHKGICPNGWHVPSSAEFQALVTFAGGTSTAGRVLKAKSGWTDSEGNPSGNGEDLLGFSALPSVTTDYGLPLSFFWSSTINDNTINDRTNEYSRTNAYGLSIMSTYTSATVSYSGKSSFYSLRCVKD